MDENDDGCDERREEEAVRGCCMCEREREREGDYNTVEPL